MLLAGKCTALVIRPKLGSFSSREGSFCFSQWHLGFLQSLQEPWLIGAQQAQCPHPAAGPGFSVPTEVLASPLRPAFPSLSCHRNTFGVAARGSLRQPQPLVRSGVLQGMSLGGSVKAESSRAPSHLGPEVDSSRSPRLPSAGLVSTEGLYMCLFTAFSSHQKACSTGRGVSWSCSLLRLQRPDHC